MPTLRKRSKLKTRAASAVPYRLEVLPLTMPGAPALLSTPHGPAYSAFSSLSLDELLMRAEHADEAVQIDLLQRNTSWMLVGDQDGGAIVRRRIESLAADRMRASGLLWTPLADAIACEVKRIDKRRLEPTALRRWISHQRTPTRLWPLLDFKYAPVRHAAFRRLMTIDRAAATERLSLEPDLSEAFTGGCPLPDRLWVHLRNWALQMLVGSHCAPTTKRPSVLPPPLGAVALLHQMAEDGRLPESALRVLVELWDGRLSDRRVRKYVGTRGPSRNAGAWAHVALVRMAPTLPLPLAVRVIDEWYAPGPRLGWVEVEFARMDLPIELLQRIAKRLRRKDREAWVHLSASPSVRIDRVVRRAIFRRAPDHVLTKQMLVPLVPEEWKALFQRPVTTPFGPPAILELLGLAEAYQLAELTEDEWAPLVPPVGNATEDTFNRLLALSAMPSARRSERIRTLLVKSGLVECIQRLCVNAVEEGYDPPILELAAMAPDTALECLTNNPSLALELEREDMAELVESENERLRMWAYERLTHAVRPIS